MKASIVLSIASLCVVTLSSAQEVEVVQNWPTYPEGTSLGGLHGDVAADSNGIVYVATGETIQVIGSDGVYKGNLGKEWGGVHGMKVRKQGDEEFLFTAQTGRKAVSKLKLDGTVVWRILGPPEVDGMYEHISKYNPTDVDVAPDGTVYVVDGYGESLVHIYDKNQKYVKTFGGKGTEDGKFDVCHNVLVDTRSGAPTLLISDRQNNRLTHYSMDGSFLKTIDAELRQPCAADIYGGLLAVGELGGRLSLYDKENNLVTRIGDEPKDRKKGHGTPPADWIEGALIGVHGCTFDSKGDLYAQEYSKFGRVVKYRITSLIEQHSEPEPASKSGNSIFEVVDNWPAYPEGTSLGGLHADMAADSQGNVYIATDGTIQIIGANGDYKGNLGKEWGGVHGMKVRKQEDEEFLFTAQNGRKAVSKLKLDGTVVWKILGPPEVDGMYEHISKYNPTDVDVAPDGTIYVVDGYGKSLVHIYDENQKYVKTFGGKGKEDGKFDVCHNVLVDTRSEAPTLLISDRQNNRLTHYSMDGSFLKTIDAELRQPCAADIYGGLLAVGELGGRLSLYDQDNNLVTRIGDEPKDRKKGHGTPPADWIEGALIGVHGCTFDSKGDLYAQEYSKFGRVVRYRITSLLEQHAEPEPPSTSGNWIFEVVDNWPTYPEGTSLGNLHADMAADSQGNVYIATDGTIQIIGANGDYKGNLGKEWGGVHGMKVRKQGDEEFLFTAQNGRKAVSKLKLDGAVVWKILGPPKVDGMYEHISKYNPTDVDVAPDGTIYVVDGYGKSLVHVYDKDQEYVKTFGGKGKEDGKFDVCHNILIDTRSEKPTLLISDRQNNRLTLYAMDGSFMKTIDAELRQPCAADIHGDLLAVGELGGRLSLYDKSNRLVARIGDDPRDRKKGNGVPPDGWYRGALVAVHGCTFDANGDLYAQEWNRYGRLVKYRIGW